MANKIIIASSPGGLSNKIKCLISAWRVCDKYNREFYLLWEKNQYWSARFSDLFENDFRQIDKEELEKLPVDSYVLSQAYRFITFPDEIPDGFAKVYPSSRGNNIDFEFDRIPIEVRQNISCYLDKLVPVEMIRNKVSSFIEIYNVNSLVGIHVRRDDFMQGKQGVGKVSSDEKFFEKMNEILKKDLNTRFLLCTDSRETEDKFIKEFGSKIIVYPKINRDRTSVVSAQEGLIDLLLLSKTKHILGTYHSSFNELAWWFGGCKAKVDIIIDEDAKKEYLNKREQYEKGLWLKLKKVVYNLLCKLRLFQK